MTLKVILEKINKCYSQISFMKKIRKEKIKLSKKLYFISGVIILLIVGFIIINGGEKEEVNNTQNNSAGQTNKSVSSPIPTLNSEQMNLLNQTISSSEFIKDLPENGVIALQFYDFSGENRIWRKSVLIGKNGFLNSGKPDIILKMHSKYIYDLNGANLCDVISSARTNGEMWAESDESNAKLLFKYSGMIKYRECLGF